MATMKEIVFGALDNALVDGREGHNIIVITEKLCDKCDLIGEYADSCGVSDFYKIRKEIDGYVEEWQLKQRTP